MKTQYSAVIFKSIHIVIFLCVLMLTSLFAKDDISAQIAELEAQKEEAIKNENYDVAMKVKQKIEDLKLEQAEKQKEAEKAKEKGKVNKEISELEAKKEEALKNEDFAEAKKIKERIEELKSKKTSNKSRDKGLEEENAGKIGTTEKEKVENLDEDSRQKIKKLKGELALAVKYRDDKKASMIKTLIEGIERGETVQVDDFLNLKPTGPSKEALDALNEREVRKIDKLLVKKDSDKTREEFNRQQQDEYLARGLLMDGKKKIVQGQYEFASQLITDAHDIKPKDDEIEHFYRLLKFPKVTIVTEKQVFSLLTDKQVKLKMKYEEDQEGLPDWTKAWKVNIIYSRKDRESRQFSGEGPLPPEILWDGKDSAGKLARDGEYSVQTLIEGEYFTKTKSEATKIELKAKPPTVQISIEEESFIPGDEKVAVKVLFEDKEAIKSWELTIINQVGAMIKRFSGSEISGEIIWDGKKENGDLVSEGETLFFKMRGKDAIGTKWESNEDTLFADIKIVNNKIVLDNIEFESGKAKLKPTSLPILDMVVLVLDSKAWFDVKIVGHTDDVGKDAYNLDLSIRRAKSVLNYFIKKGVSKDRLTSEGKGEAEPIASNDTAEGKARNRRVEFFLKEDTEKRDAYYEKKRQEAKQRAMNK